MKICSPYNFKKLYLDFPVFNDPASELKIGYVNINSVLEGKSDELLNNDENLLNLDFLVVADTRLTEKTKTDMSNKYCQFSKSAPTMKIGQDFLAI